MHYLTWGENIDEKKYWEAYVAVNHIFAKQVAKHCETGDIGKIVGFIIHPFITTCFTKVTLVVIHDYHLLLVPQMLRGLVSQIKIGLFVHTPFVSSEIFRCLPRVCHNSLHVIHEN